MDILLILSCFILCLFVLLYKCKIRQIRKEQRNKVQFYVKKPIFYNPQLFIKNKSDELAFICYYDRFWSFGLKQKDFADMKDGEIREVFIKLED